MLTTALGGRLFALAGRFLGHRGQSAATRTAALPVNEMQIRTYADKARGQGFDQLLLYLTFDCDTDEDAAAALELDPWLRSRGIRPAYAVPGTQLARAADSYRRLAVSGAEFLN